MSKPTTETQTQQAAKPARKSLAERRADKIAELQAKQRLELGVALARTHIEAIKLAIREKGYAHGALMCDALRDVLNECAALNAPKVDDEAGQ